MLLHAFSLNTINTLKRRTKVYSYLHIVCSQYLSNRQSCLKTHTLLRWVAIRALQTDHFYKHVVQLLIKCRVDTRIVCHFSLTGTHVFRKCKKDLLVAYSVTIMFFPNTLVEESSRYTFGIFCHPIRWCYLTSTLSSNRLYFSFG